MASSAAAMPGAMALTFTSPAAAMAAKVIITPTTVPSSPRNGPPEMQIVSSTISLLSFCVSRTRPPSRLARIAWIERPERPRSTPRSRSAARRWRIFLHADVVDAIDGRCAHGALRLPVSTPSAERLRFLGVPRVEHGEVGGDVLPCFMNACVPLA